MNTSKLGLPDKSLPWYGEVKAYFLWFFEVLRGRSCMRGCFTGETRKTPHNSISPREVLKTYPLKGGNSPLAISKEKKREIVDSDNRFVVTTKRRDEIGAVKDIQPQRANLEG